MLYATLGFRQFSHHFTAVRDALLAGDENWRASILATWMRKDLVTLQRSQIVRHVIAYSVIRPTAMSLASLPGTRCWQPGPGPGRRGAVSGWPVPGALCQPAAAARWK